MFDLKYPECNIQCVQHLEKVTKLEGAGSIGAVVAKPIQGSGGIIVPLDEWWPIVREICRWEVSAELRWLTNWPVDRGSYRREGGKGGKRRNTAKIEKTCGNRSFWGN